MNLLIRDCAHVLQFGQNDGIFEDPSQSVQHIRGQLLLLVVAMIIRGFVFIVRIIEIQQFLVESSFLILLILQHLEDLLQLLGDILFTRVTKIDRRRSNVLIRIHFNDILLCRRLLLIISSAQDLFFDGFRCVGIRIRQIE